MWLDLGFEKYRFVICMFCQEVVNQLRYALESTQNGLYWPWQL
jgi:hypothetical protein